MSDIGILNGPFSMLAIALLLGSPGLVIGGLAGLLWRGHRIAGVLLGATIGFASCLVGFMYFNDVI